jgi:hypothetical protein
MNLVQVFDVRKDGVMRWWSAPPVDSISTNIPHTPTYLEYKLKQKIEKEKEGGRDVEREIVGNGMERVEIEMVVDVEEGEGDGDLIEKILYGFFLNVEKLILIDYAGVLGTVFKVE